MMNFADFVLCLLTGVAVPMALAGFVAEAAILEAAAGHGVRLRRVLGAWSAAMVAGPGLFALRLVEGWKSGREGLGEQLSGWLACAGWATLYGYVLLNGVRLAIGHA